MSRKKKMKMEYRFYEVPEKCPVLALLGEKWVQNYGYQIDYLHFLSTYDKLKGKQSVLLGMAVY